MTPNGECIERRWTYHLHFFTSPEYCKVFLFHFYKFLFCRALLCFAKLGGTSAEQSKKNILFCFALRSVCTTLLRQVRRHLSRTKQKNILFALLCVRFALLCFAKLGGTSAEQSKKIYFFALLCVRFALTLHNNYIITLK